MQCKLRSTYLWCSYVISGALLATLYKANVIQYSVPLSVRPSLHQNFANTRTEPFLLANSPRLCVRCAESWSGRLGGAALPPAPPPRPLFCFARAVFALAQCEEPKKSAAQKQQYKAKIIKQHGFKGLRTERANLYFRQMHEKIYYTCINVANSYLAI